MASQQFTDRVTRLEAELIELQAEVHASRGGVKNWRRAVQEYAGDEDLLNVFRDAEQLREADRKRTGQSGPQDVHPFTRRVAEHRPRR